MLPNHKQAYIPESKLTKYLLSETHAVGKTKAKYFRSIGYTKANTARLADDLLMIATSQEVSQSVVIPYGAKYIIDGDIFTPIGSIVRICTVWVVELDDKRPRFVTAYPVKNRCLTRKQK
jgi:hypothetical protein